MLKKLLFSIMTCIILSSCQQQNSTAIKIGIVVPIEHKAMDEIVNGFSTTLKQSFSQPITIKIENAQGDANLQRAILQQMRDQQYTMIVPIGMTATQMAVSMLKKQPIVSLATDFSEQDRSKLNPCNLAIVDDEITPKQLIQFIHTVYPQLTQLILIHSSADKIMPQVAETIAAGKQNNMTINHLMVATLPELYTSAQAIPPQTQGIFILKDNLIASGISTLEKIAETRHIPLMTSDQGSVQDGAGFALGVHEKEIGIAGAKLAGDILHGKSACALPITKMTKLTVFINQNSLKKAEQNPEPILTAAKQLGYAVELSGP